jgi:hypothetical protein
VLLRICVCGAVAVVLAPDQGLSNRLLAGGAAGGTADANGHSEAFLLLMQFRVALQQQVCVRVWGVPGGTGAGQGAGANTIVLTCLHVSCGPTSAKHCRQQGRQGVGVQGLR